MSIFHNLSTYVPKHPIAMALLPEEKVSLQPFSTTLYCCQVVAKEVGIKNNTFSIKEPISRLNFDWNRKNLVLPTIYCYVLFKQKSLGLFKVKLIQCLSCKKVNKRQRKLGETGGLNSGIICFTLWPACMHMMND